MPSPALILPGVFLSTPSARRATHGHGRPVFCDLISIHALREEGDLPPRCRCSPAGNFYPRPPRGGRRLWTAWRRRSWEFLSTPSARRATADRRNHAARIGDFYPRPPRGGRPAGGHLIRTREEFLSTPSARRATAHQGAVDLSDLISIHALREEGDAADPVLPASPPYFYPRPPRGGRHEIPVFFKDNLRFLSTPSARRAT